MSNDITVMRIALATILLVAFPGSAWGQDRCPDPGVLLAGMEPPIADIRYLADDALAGREVGTDGAACAAAYLADRFQAAGLRPAGPDGSFYQPFSVTVGAELGESNHLTVAGQSYTFGEDWIPYGFSGTDDVSGELLFGGFGMSGTILVMEAPDPHSPEAQSMESDPHFLASAAGRHGTVAVVVVLRPGMDLPDPARESRPAVPIPVVAVTNEVGASILEAAEDLVEAEVTTEVRPAQRDARNVVGLLPGSDARLRDEVVIVGAHFDHLGLGGDGSLAPDATGTVHNGADDNASGTAALLEVATRLASDPTPPARSVLFLAFSGEEKGLWGSAEYVKAPVVPLENSVAMINMDMVGRLDEGVLTIFGVATAEEWDATVTDANAALTAPLELSLLPDGYGPSDHSSFYGEGIPVLHFFTNAHEDYHRPSDDWDKIDAEGLLEVVDLVAAVTRRVAGTGSTALAMTPVEGAGTPHGGAPAPSGDEDQANSGGYGPYLGTIPDMTPQDTGVRLTGVREGSPAQVAGIQAGDVIVEFAGREVGDLYAYTYALRDHRPGDEVTIVVLREGERVEVQAVLGQRR